MENSRVLSVFQNKKIYFSITRVKSSYIQLPCDALKYIALVVATFKLKISFKVYLIPEWSRQKSQYIFLIVCLNLFLHFIFIQEAEFQGLNHLLYFYLLKIFIFRDLYFEHLRFMENEIHKYHDIS
jgi:hypothetical protein